MQRPLGLFLIALLLRVGWFVWLPATDPPDTAIYLESGRTLAESGLMSSPLYMPLYPIFLHLFGSATVPVQLGLSAATVCLVYALAKHLWSNANAALFAGWLCAIHPMLIYYANLRLTETLYIFLLVAGLLLLCQRQVLFGCTVLVASNLVRPSLDLVLPLIVGLVAYGWRRSTADVARALPVYALVYVSLMTPWWAHNYSLHGQFVRLNLADGVTAILENNEAFRRGEPDATWSAFEAIDDPVAKNEAMKRAALSYIVANPSVWVVGCFDRLRRFMLPWPNGGVPIAGKLVSASIILTLFLAAGIGLWRARRGILRFAPIAVPMIFVSAIHVATHANERYRLPIDPILCVVAGGAVLRPKASHKV